MRRMKITSKMINSIIQATGAGLVMYNANVDMTSKPGYLMLVGLMLTMGVVTVETKGRKRII